MSLGLVVLASAVVFALIVAALPLWDIRRQLLATWDARDLAVLGLTVLAVLLPVAVFVMASPYVAWLGNIIPRSLMPDEPQTVSDQAAVAQNLNGRAELYRSQGRYHEAEALIREALAIVEKAAGRNHPDVSIPLSRLAQLFCEQGRYLEAEPLYERALAIREQALGRYHPSVTVILTNLADLYRSQGRDADAEPLYRRALTIDQFALGADHPSSGTTVNNLALSLCNQGRFVEAEPLFKRSLAGWHDLAGCLTNVADLYRAQGYYVEAAPLYKRSRAALDDALHRLSQDTSAASVDQMFLTTQRALAAEAGASLADMAARGLKADLRSAAVYPGPQNASDWQQRDDKTTERAQQVNASSEPFSIAQVQAELGSNEALVLYLTSFERDATLVWVVTKAAVRWQWSELSTTALVESAKALRCGLDPTLWKEARSADKCKELLKMPPGQGTADEPMAENLPFNLARAHDLYRALLAPFRDFINDKSLLIITSPLLNYLPFHVLVTEPPKTAILSRLDQYRDVPWLATRHPIAVLPSLSALSVLRQRAKTSIASRIYLGVGNPLLDGRQDDPVWGRYYKSQARAALDNQQCPEAVGKHRAVVARRPLVGASESAFKGDELRTWDPLPETAEVLCEVGRRLEASNSDILLGSQASESAIRALSQSGRLAEYRILFFGTHCALAGQVRGVPEPGLVLTPQAAGALDSAGRDRDDGLLRADAIKALKLNADWVVLSPCSNSRESADTMAGLVVAFFQAGARALLIPYWGVGSEAAVKLTTAAFIELSAKPTIGQAQAMRNAMRNLMMHGSLLEAHPSQWAPFVVVGGEFEGS